MTKITRIGVLFSARLLARYGLGLGLIAGMIYSIGGAGFDALVSLGWISSSAASGLGAGTLLAFLSLIGMPLLFAAAGFLGGAIGAVFYNLTASRLGGLEPDIQTEV